MNDTRTDTARQHDDSDLIEATTRTPPQGGRSGGDLAKDVGTEAAEDRVRDPESRERVTKADEMAHGTDQAEDRVRD